jgi:tetratricopeptide (TPR) repeat protein
VSEDKAVLIKTAYSYYQKGDWDRAIEEYHKLADLDPKDINVHNMLADIYAKKGDVKEALQQYDLVAQGFDQKNQVDKVLQVYKRMLKLVPNDPQLLNAVKNLINKYLTRAAEMEEQDMEKASEIYRSVLKAEPERLDANFQYAKLLVKKGQKFEAVESLMNFAAALDAETQTGRLVEVLQAVTEVDALNIEAREKLADILIKARQTGPAIKSLQDLIEIHISKNDFIKAQEAAQRSLDLGDQGTYYHLGVIYFNQQKYAESRAAFEKFLQQQDGHVGALKYLALACLRLNQSPEAVQVYLRILDVYFNENLLDEAREVRQTILELDPQNETVSRYALDLAQPVQEEERAGGAHGGPSQDDAARMEGEQQQILLSQAQAFIEKGFYEQAIDAYLEMLKRWPNLPDIRVRLQQVYALMARSMEPVEKAPSTEEIKSELERELREQMKRELQEQARVAQERQQEMDKKRELDQMMLKQELESKLLEQVQKTKEEELRLRVTREFEEKQRLLTTEKERLEREKADSYDRLKAELEETKTSLEQRIRAQIEREMAEKLERESRLKDALQKEKEEQRLEEKQREEYATQKKEQEAAKAKINQEIHQGMERLRLEKEKESKAAPAREPEKNETSEAAPVSVGPAQASLDDPFVRQTLAEIYAKQGLYVEALKIYERILNEEPDNEDVRQKLRDILRLKGI